MFGLLQLAYFSLGDHDFFHIYLHPLVELRRVNGFNRLLFDEDNSSLPAQMEEMGIATFFINNCNIMVFVLFFQVLVSFLVFCLGRAFGSPKAKKIG